MKLTDEQIEKAAEAARIAHYGVNGPPTPWESTYRDDKDRWRRIVREAAPFLQIPLDEPSAEELRLLDEEIAEVADAVSFWRDQVGNLFSSFSCEYSTRKTCRWGRTLLRLTGIMEELSRGMKG